MNSFSHTALIVDDDPGNRSYLRNLLAQHAPDILVVGEAGNIKEASKALEAQSIDLVLLDVEMPGGSGFDLLKQMGRWSFQVIFATAFHRYAIQAIRFSALDYLLKPVHPDELKAALERFREQKLHGPVKEEVQKQFIRNIEDGRETALRLTLSSGDHNYFVPPSEVMRCHADNNYTELYLTDGRRFISARTLKEYEEMLKPWGFLRVHRSSLVNRDSVSHVDELHVVMKCGDRIEVSRRKREEVILALSA